MTAPKCQRPLAGVRVVAIEQAVAAPLCSRHLADLGADVIKIERPDGGDFSRDYDGFVRGFASHFVWLNYGKKSVTLDLKSKDGRSALVRMLEGADVLLSNLGPGALERLVNADELDRRNPRLITCRISGYGPTGPYRNRKAFDLLIQGEAGVTANTGTRRQPAKPGVSLADLAGGIYASAAILAALRGRDVSGRGSRLEISMFDVLAEWMSPLVLAYREGGVLVEPAGTRHATITPYGPFVTADGTVLNIAVQNDRQWLDLCEVLGLADLSADETLLGNSGRLGSRDRVEDAVAEAVLQWSPEALATALDAAGVPWGSLNDTAAVARHPQLEATGRWREVILPNGQAAEVLASPLLPGEGDADATTRPRVPALGEHTDEVLREMAVHEKVEVDG